MSAFVRQGPDHFRCRRYPMMAMRPKVAMTDMTPAIQMWVTSIDCILISSSLLAPWPTDSIPDPVDGAAKQHYDRNENRRFNEDAPEHVAAPGFNPRLRPWSRVGTGTLRNGSNLVLPMRAHFRPRQLRASPPG